MISPVISLVISLVVFPAVFPRVVFLSFSLVSPAVFPRVVFPSFSLVVSSGLAALYPIRPEARSSFWRAERWAPVA